MTLDSTSDSTAGDNSGETPQSGTPAAGGRKPGRRRATRSVAPPQHPAEAPAAQPASPTTGSTSATGASGAGSSAPAEPATTEPVVTTTEQGERPARRSRRATRDTTSATPAVTPDADTSAAAPAASATTEAGDGADAGQTGAGTARSTAKTAGGRSTGRTRSGAAKRSSKAAAQTPEAADTADATESASPTAEPAGRAQAPVLDVLSEFGLTTRSTVPEATTSREPDADALFGAPEEPRRPRRASRRATSAPTTEGGATDVAPAEGETAPGASRTGAAPAVDAGAPAAEAAAEKKPARRSRRATKTQAEPETAQPATLEDATGSAPESAAPADASAETPAVPADDAQERPRARRSRRKAAPAGPDESTAVDETPAQAAAEPAGTQADEKAEKKTGRKSGTKADKRADKKADEKSGRTGDESPATTTTGGTPRLATTALLFQAPDPAAAPRRSRRAQSPAGPPRHVEPTPTAPASQEPPAATSEATERPAERGGRTPAAEPAPETPAVLSGEDRAAVEEIELIESELAAEGVELPDDAFGPEDFVDLEEEPQDEAGDSDEADTAPRRRRRRGGRGRRGRPDAPREADDSESVESGESEGAAPEAGTTGEPADAEPAEDAAGSTEGDDDESGSSRRRRRRRRGGRGENGDGPTRPRSRDRSLADEVTALKGSTRLEAKRQRRREGRDAGRRRQIITEAEFLARRESVERSMVVREKDGRTQIAVLEDGVLVEHYVSQQSQTSMAGNVYLGRVQNVLPSMEAAFIDVGKGRNAVLYAGEVNWDAAGLEGQPRRIEQALKSGDSVLVQVTKDPIGHKGARLTSQVTLAGRYLVFVPGGGMTGISRKLPDTERNRLKKILKEVVPDGAGVIVRTAAEGASEEELRADVERLRGQWDAIQKKAKSASAPALLQGEPDLAIRVVRDIFNDDFSSLVVEGDGAWDEISTYVEELAPDLRERVSRWTGQQDVFTVHRVDEQLAKGMDRKVWLPSGGSLVIDRTEAMTVVDVNTGKFTGSGGTLEETVTRNNLEAAEEIVRQLRLRDIGGIIVIDFIDMVLESNRDLVLRRLVECLGRDRTKHQVAEVTSLGLVQMTRKRVGQGLVEAFSETCEHCHGRGFVVHTEPVERSGGNGNGNGGSSDDAGEGRSRSRRKRSGSGSGSGSASSSGSSKDAAIALPHAGVPVLPEVSSQAREAVKATLATIAAAAAHAHEHEDVEGLEPAVGTDGDATAGTAPEPSAGDETPAESVPAAAEPDETSEDGTAPTA
ncbi:Rne/Rng family ribonuclease [Cellulosimicrobium sp. NPDC057127]|uniref:Rne/Rng family ribonuclease n=1 Tax=Cellulosimicrobium sp. NPDC057127 TaxID=3346026 RepID=UPI00363F4347